MAQERTFPEHLRRLGKRKLFHDKSFLQFGSLNVRPELGWTIEFPEPILHNTKTVGTFVFPGTKWIWKISAKRYQL